MGKRIIKSVAPKLAEAAVKGGKDIISGKKSVKQVIKEGVKQNKKEIMSATTAAIKKELNNFKKKQKGGLLMNVRQKKGISKRKNR